MFERCKYMAGFYPAQDLKGADILTIVVKRAYDIDLVEAKCVVAETQDDIVIGDEYSNGDDPFKSSVKIESEIAPWKVMKDIVFVGKAYAPKGKKAKTWDVTMQVGRAKRSLRIFGPRKVAWVPPIESKKKGEPPTIQPPVIGDPEPIAEVDLTYENAYGGFATYWPEHPEAFRKAVRKAKKKAQKKDDEKKAKDEDKKKQAEDEKKAAVIAEKKKAEAAKQKAFFTEGEKKIEDAPDVELEVELGSAHRKSAGGTVVLDLAELAEAEQREAEEAAAEAKALAEAAKKRLAEGPKAEADGALLGDADYLAKLAAEGTAESLAELEAYQADRARQANKDGSGAATVDTADEGDELESDESWILAQKEERERFYESLGLDANEEVTWEEGEFPRIPCPSNFVGKGFAMRNCKESLDGLEMPLIEDPERLITPEDLPRDPATLHSDVRVPAGFGFTSRGWLPRSLMVGLTEAEMAEAQHKMDKELVGLDPDDPDDQLTINAIMERKPQKMDPAYFNGAHPKWQVKELYGDEDINLVNLDKSGTTYFKLPASRPAVRFERGKGWEKVDVTLDTLVIDREAAKVVMVWRGRLPFGGVSEMDGWTKVDIDVVDMTVAEWRETQEREAIERRRKPQELILGVDEIAAEEAAAFDARIEQAEVGGGVRETRPTDSRETRAEDGALIEVEDREDVLMVEDWVDDAKLAQLSEEERKKLELARDEKKAVQEKKKELKAKMDALKQKQEEEAAAAAEAEKKKKKKKKKKEEKPEGEDEDEDDGDPPEEGGAPEKKG